MNPSGQVTAGGSFAKRSRRTCELTRLMVAFSAACVLTVALGAGTSLAATLIGTAGLDRIAGTTQADWINGRAGNDRISGGVGEDRIRGGLGIGVIKAKDDWFADRVDCGPGFDTIIVDPDARKRGDVYTNCEFRSVPGGPQ